MTDSVVTYLDFGTKHLHLAKANGGLGIARCGFGAAKAVDDPLPARFYPAIRREGAAVSLRLNFPLPRALTRRAPADYRPSVTREEEERILGTPGLAEGLKHADRLIEDWKRGLEESGEEDAALAEADMAAGFETLAAPEPCGEPGCCRLHGHTGPVCKRRERGGT